MEPLYSANLPSLTGPRIMEMSWESLTFVHWAYDPDVVQALLPPGLTVDTFDGKAWIGLVPFRIVIRPPHLPSIPWATRFPETNVRTYVERDDGTTAVWFMSLDASRLAAVALARKTYRIPYFWAKMSIQREGNTIAYRSERRWPGPRGAHCHATVAIGNSIDPADLTQLDHFLTARGSLFSATRSGFGQAHLFHPPWPLRHASLTHLDQSVIEATGLPAPVGEPHVRYADSVEVAIGLPRRHPKSKPS